MCATLRTGEERCWGGTPTAWDHGRGIGELGDDETPALWAPPHRSAPRFEPLLPDGRVLMRARDLRGMEWEIRVTVRGDLPRVRGFIAREFEHFSSDHEGEIATDSACALARDERIWCWGTNASGELGQDDRLPEDREALVHVLRE